MNKAMPMDITAPSPNKNLPRIYVDVSKADLPELDGVEVGKRITLTLMGKVVEITKRQDDQGKYGTIAIENEDVKVGPAPNGDFADMMDEGE